MIHILACFWILLGLETGNSWIVNYFSEANNMMFTEDSLYISSIYWVITTLTTVGFGDIRAYNKYEQLYTMGVEFLGIAFFGLIMGTINKVLGEEDGAADIIDSKLEEVDLWLLKLDNSRNDKSLPRKLYEKIKEYIERSLKQDYDILIEGYDFFDQLKPSLRYKVVYEVFEEFIDHFYPSLFKEITYEGD